MTQSVSALDIYLNAKKAYEEKRLQAQHMTERSNRCCYVDPETGYRCAIGVSMSDKTINTVRRNGNNSALISSLERVFKTSHPNMASHLQLSHDNWIRAHASKSYYEGLFTECLDVGIKTLTDFVSAGGGA